MNIAISKGAGSEKYTNYSKWLQCAYPQLQITELSEYPLNEIPAILKKCDGLVLTGGEDIDPKRYGFERPELKLDFDPERDMREWLMLETAIGRNTPLLGICRGLQLINVYFNGTLIMDISTDVKTTTVHRDVENDTWHDVTVMETSFLGEKGSLLHVNSAHHQAISTIGTTLRPIAVSADGIIEAVESVEHPIIAVQWHPERMKTGNGSVLVLQKFMSSLSH